MDREATLAVLRSLNVPVLSENGQWMNAHCPFSPWTHKRGSDTTPSFGVKYNKHGQTTFGCQACKQTGTITSLIQKLGQRRGLDYAKLAHDARMVEMGAALMLDFVPFDRPYEEPAEILQPLNEVLYTGIWPDAYDVPQAAHYLAGRGISRGTAEQLGLLYRESYTRPNRDGIGTHEWHRQDILFPVRDASGALYGWSGRTTLPDVKPKIFDEDLPKRHLLLGEQRWRQGMPKLIVEGLFGYAHLVEIGVEDICDVGALMGSKLSPEKVAILKAWGDTVIALPDYDEAGDICLFGPHTEDGGREASKGMIAPLQGAVVLLVPDWPEGKCDPDQLTYEEVNMMLETTPYPKSSLDKHFY